MQKTTSQDLLKAARSIPCIEVLDGRPPVNVKRCLVEFYPDQRDLLIDRLTKLPKRESVLVALTEGGNVGLYRRPRK